MSSIGEQSRIRTNPRQALCPRFLFPTEASKKKSKYLQNKIDDRKESCVLFESVKKREKGQTEESVGGDGFFKLNSLDSAFALSAIPCHKAKGVAPNLSN